MTRIRRLVTVLLFGVALPNCNLISSDCGTGDASCDALAWLSYIVTVSPNVTFFAVTDAGQAFISTDDGYNWTLINYTGAGSPITRVAFVTATRLIGLDGASDQYYISDDLGKTWTQQTGPGVAGNTNRDIAACGGQTVIAGPNSGGTDVIGHYSSDGINFTQSSTNILGGATTFTNVSCGDDSHFYAAVNTGGPRRSFDGGVNWGTATTFPTNTQSFTNGEAVTGGSDGRVIGVRANTSPEIYYSTDYGINYTVTSAPGQYASYSGATVLTSSSWIVARSQGAGSCDANRSSNLSGTTIAFTCNATASSIQAAAVNSVGTIAMAGTLTGPVPVLYISRDEGSTWSEISPPSSSATAIRDIAAYRF